jgi:hypothetical protein
MAAASYWPLLFGDAVVKNGICISGEKILKVTRPVISF